MMNQHTWQRFLIVVGVLGYGHPIAVDAFSSISTFTSFATKKMTPRMSSPNNWDNDDFLNSLGGGGDSNPMNDGNDNTQQPVERIVPANEMTDEEITMMAMNPAKFYNTDTPMQEAYGTPRQGPPRKEQVDDIDEKGEFQ